MRKKIIITCLLLLLAYGILSKAYMGLDAGHQHDFISYYYGTKAMITGSNGYDSQIVSALSGQGHQSHLRFVYPPQMAWLFAPLTAVPFLEARLIFLGLKLIAGACLIALFLRYVIKKEFLVAFVMIAVFAFRGPFTSDILAGNIATFETLLLWGGFLCLLLGRSYLFAIAIAIAASFKLLPLAFLGFIFLTKQSKKWSILGTGIGIFGIIQSIGFFGMPTMYQEFLNSPKPLDSSGYVNPSILAWLQFDLEPWLALHNITVSTSVIYGLWILGFSSVMAVFFLKKRHGYPLIIQISIAVLSYGLLLPRLKDYSFLIFVIPAYYAVIALPKRWQQVLVLALFCVSLWPYHHWTMLLLALGILVKYGHSLEKNIAEEPLRLSRVCKG
jgi:hypothetical protein